MKKLITKNFIMSAVLISTLAVVGYSIHSKIGLNFAVGATEITSLHQSFNFLDGGDNNDNAYAGVNKVTNVSFAADNPGGTSGTTEWEADYANLSLAYGTRLGGKLLSEVQTDDTTPWGNIKTKFKVSLPIDVVTIKGSVFFGTNGDTYLTGFYLQSSSDSVTWTTVKQLPVPDLTISAAENPGIDIVFDGFTIPADSYIRFGVGQTVSAVNVGFQFTGMTFNSYTLC